MGFRGEALASITAISKLTMITKTQEDDTGLKIVVEAGDILQAEEIAGTNGTIITVENLFFNTPVRYKFLKQDATEFRYIKELVQKIALANLNVSIKLFNNGKQVFSSSGNGQIKDLVYLLYGKNVKDYLVEVNYKECDISITGVVGNTLMARESRKDQIIFLNKRNIKNVVLTNSADQAFKGSTGIGKYGFFILNIEMPANYYDVNVHPTKSEVRFKDEDKIYKILYSAIKTSLLNKEFLGNDEQSDKKEYVKNELDFLTNHYEGNFEKGSNKKNYFNKRTSFYNDENKGVKGLSEINTMQKNNYNTDLNSSIQRENKRNVNYKFLGISFKTYIIVEIENEIYIIDQHAAHERLLYEQIKENYKNHLENNTQMMLIPDVINLTHKEYEFVNNNIELFNKYGFDIEIFGENSIKINGIPDIEYKVKTTRKDIFMDILDEMATNSRSPIKDIEERFVATVACKAAVKAGMDLTSLEVDFLVQNLLRLQNPYTCPHGRPTTIKLNKNELKMDFIV